MTAVLQPVLHPTSAPGDGGEVFIQKKEEQEAPLGEGWGVGLTPDGFGSIYKLFTVPPTNSFTVPQMGKTFLYLPPYSQRPHWETKDDSSSEIKEDKGLNAPQDQTHARPQQSNKQLTTSQDVGILSVSLSPANH